ncbi:Carbohydrate sulfotransferase 12-like [Oopsacas minuta]|uniref:Carbohydrate sulfotransferase n=1 Tax=Oopsacas minuta TaxID=111878 RepID=A0AAV7KBC7_9METZ|nr:Carbohydrate sulfotransferase 12-like [Oopsacas minuta]
MKKLTRKELFIFILILYTLITTFYITQFSEPNEYFIKEEIHKNKKEKIIENNVSWINYRKNWNQEVLVTTNIADKTLKFTDKYRMEMTSKGLHPLNLQHKYLHDRIDRIDQFCNVSLLESKGIYKLFGSYYRVRFSDKSELLQCAVLKVSSRTWIHLLRELEGMKEESFPYQKTFRRISMDFNYQNPKLNAQRYQTYTKFLIARNPFQRLLSGYTDQFITRYRLGKPYFYEVITINYLSNLTKEYITQLRNELKKGEERLTQGLDSSIIQQIRRLNAGYGKSKITFLEFLNFVIYSFRNKGFYGLNDHWKPISHFCDPCAIKYDIIAKFETLKEDSDAILNYVQRNNPKRKVTFPNDHPTTTLDCCNEEFRIVPLNVRRSIYEIFKQDYLLFGYEYREDENNIC